MLENAHEKSGSHVGVPIARQQPLTTPATLLLSIRHRNKNAGSDRSTMFRKLFHQKSKTTRDGEGATDAGVNPSNYLAQAQEILGKLRDDDSIADPFPALNEATRLVSQLDNHVRSMPATDSMKDIWIEQVSEVQRELQKVTESTVSKMSEVPRSPLMGGADQRASDSQMDGGMDDLFSGLSVSDVGNSAPAPATATTPNPTASTGTMDKGQSPAASRPELDLDLFSDLVTVDPISLESATTTSSQTPSAAKPVQPSASSPEPSPPPAAAAAVTPPSPQPYAAPAFQTSGKKKKKINQIGYGRVSEPIGFDKPRSNSAVTVNSAGSWVDVGLKSKPSNSSELPNRQNLNDGGPPAGGDASVTSSGFGLDSGSLAQNRISGSHNVEEESQLVDGIETVDLHPSHPVPVAGLHSEADRVEPRSAPPNPMEASNSESLMVENGGARAGAAPCYKKPSQLDDLRRRAADSAASTERTLEKLKKTMGVLNGDQLGSLQQLATDKGKILELESKQTAAVESEDFEKAASLATEIDTLLEGVARCRVTVAKVERDLESCASNQVEIRRARVAFLVDALAEVGGLKDECQAASDKSRVKMESELKALEAALEDKKSGIQAKEAWLPEEQSDIEKCRSTMEQNAATRKEVKEARMADLHEQEEQLQAEIEQLKAELAAKEVALGGIVVEMHDLAEAQDTELEQETAALADREAGLAEEEAQLAELKKQAELSEAECGANREAAAKAMEEFNSQMEELLGVSEKYEEQLKSAETASKMEKDLFELLSGLAESKRGAEEHRQQLEADSEHQKEALKNLGSEIKSVGVAIRGLQEEIRKAEVRLPELDELKKAAAASKDFKEAAALSAQAKEIAALKDSAELKLSETTAHLSDREQCHKDMTNRVTMLATQLEQARRAAGLAEYIQLKSKLEGERLGLVAAVADGGAVVLESVCAGLEAEFQFDEASISDALKAVGALTEAC